MKMEFAGKSTNVWNVFGGTLFYLWFFFPLDYLIWLKMRENAWWCWRNCSAADSNDGYCQASLSPPRSALASVTAKVKGLLRSTRQGNQKMDGCDWWCVGSTSGKKPVIADDLSDAVILFSGSSLAGVNARSESLSSCREVTDFCPECGQLNWGESKNSKWWRKEEKVVYERDSTSLSRWLPSPVI